MPSATPRHNRIVSKAIRLLDPGLRELGEAIPETDFSDGRRTTLRPDLAILFNDKLSGLDLDKLPVTVAPDIVIEVISPSESLFRVGRKVDAYFRFGAQEVWIIDPQNRHIYLHAATGLKLLRSGDTLESPLIPGWAVAIDQLFER